jgi:hypothetical protein
MRTGEYAQVCSAQQLNKAIPLLLDMRNDLKEMKGDIKAVRKNMDAIPRLEANTNLVLEEIKGMREDIQPGYAKQMQTDIRAIKERLGMQ